MEDFTDHLVNGAWRKGSGGEFESVDPYLRKPWARLTAASESDVDGAVTAARAAWPAWRRMPAYERAKLLFRLADLIERDADELAEYDTRDNGKIFKEQRGQNLFAARNIRFIAGAADKVLGETKPQDTYDLIDFTVREPLGVVAAISAWNGPLQNAVNKVAPAVAAGNCVVLKPSEFTSVSALALGKLVVEAGFPPGVVNIITGAAETGQALTAHPGINKVAFTGGIEAARRIAGNTARNMVPGLYELGGKSASIVFADADLGRAVPGAVAGIFAAAGQSCVAGSRLLVHESVYDEVIDGIVDMAGKISFGNPLDPATQVGPVAHEAHFQRIQQAIGEAVEDGARLVIGGGNPEGLDGTLFAAPTLFADVTPDMRLAQREVFGPVLAVLKFSSDEEAIDIANGTEYGLAAGIWTTDFARAHRVARELIAGTVWINTYRTISATAPFGGFNRSGYGRERGTDVLAEYTATKNLMLDISDGARDPFMMRTGK
ncbi:aldehyde dehydrogenase [Amycolatopsis acidicola]|uniref:Aldehyde dehydrogenase n=1 Tax=Amycolatopsis acidicola TaxID=2596893 RepID=A0A5N0VF57_9PSEU|nr:aldehyde dehydrogenase [Amycolatopsis acidicola]KAA9163322.1 aldehyde dehydrogenase [Amycolatopsis acidicola]